MGNTRKSAVGPKLSLFTPGVMSDFESLIKKQNEVANFTYKKGPYNGMPEKVIGMYILLADDTEPGFHSDNYDWEPKLHPYQQLAPMSCSSPSSIPAPWMSPWLSKDLLLHDVKTQRELFLVIRELFLQ